MESIATTADPAVRYEVGDRVATITLNRPGRSNALDLELAHRLSVALARAGDDPDCDAVVLGGAGERFCVGGDLRAMAAAPDRPAFLAELAAAAHQAVRAMQGLAKPIVVAVQGAAAGVGFSLALSADLVVAGHSATFVTAYTSVGLTPDGGLSWLLPRTVGQQRALALILTSAPLSADAAHRLGIVAELSDDAGVASCAHSLAIRLAGQPRHALVGARRLVRSSWEATLDEHLDREAASISRSVAEESTVSLIERFLGR
jgi:2-(1,2-epoxy-1,2-dihydrophenyl)acetyl-CoA isomerase